MPLEISQGGTASATAAGARLKLGLTDLATMDPSDVAITGGTIDGVDITGGTITGLDTPVAIADGGTASTTAADARTALFSVSTTTDNAIARYDGITGALQNSSVIIDDSGNIVTSGSITATSFTGTIDADTLDGLDSTDFVLGTDYTAANILSKLITVDGSTSGLDADLLDGNHSTAFATAAQGALADSAIQSGDLATVATTGSYDDLINTPTASDLLTSIKTVDGSGSGLDADTIDGHDTSYFQTALGYTPANIAGDTFTGQLKMTNGIEIVTGLGNVFRMKSDGIAATTGYGVFWRVDNNTTYLMRTAVDDPDGIWDPPFIFTIPHSTKLVSVAGDPTAALGIATKQYVDTQISGINPISTIYASGGNNSIGGSVTDYAGPGGFSTTESVVRGVFPVAGTVSNLFVKTDTNISAGSVTVMFRLNSANTTLTTTISSGSTGSDTTHSVVVAAGDLWAIRETTVGLTTTHKSTYSFQFEAS